MGVDLFDQSTNEIIFSVNFWHWRAIVEAVRSLHILSQIDSLHEPYVGELTEEDARRVAERIRERLLPKLEKGERLLLDGSRTTESDDGTFHQDPAEQHRNYSTNRDVLEEFALCCARCHGFRVS